MNLHAIAGPAIAVVNPFTAVTVRLSTGYTTEDDGTRVPTYDEYDDVPAQIQALSWGDLQKLDGLNLQGEKRKIYLTGRFDGISRERQTGGDLIAYPDGDQWPFGTLWLISAVLEQWPDWVCVAVTQQRCRNDGLS